MRGILQRLFQEETILSGIVLMMAAISPNIFPAAQAGHAKMSWLATWLLIPSLVVLVAVFLVAALRHQRRLINRMMAGAGAGLLATFALDVVRLAGFHLGWMPGDLGMLLGVLITDRFMSGPSTLSNIVGYTYHYWNGAAFGIIFAVLFGRKPIVWGIGYGLLIATVFLMTPAVQATGAGFMGMQMPMMPFTVYLAHLAFGAVLGLVCKKWVHEDTWFLGHTGGVTMNCHRCNGLMIAEECDDIWDKPGQSCVAAYHCLNCGEIVDPVILANRKRRPDTTALDKALKLVAAHGQEAEHV